MKNCLTILALSLSSLSFAQSDSAVRNLSLSERQARIAKPAAIGLTTWGAVNIVGGLIGRNNSIGETKYFHEMNFGFNTVNFVLGGSSWMAANQTKTMTESQAIEQGHQLEKVYLFNSALDLVYMASGWAIYIKGLSQTGLKADRSFGYGKSLVLQGGFLLVYDWILYGLHRSSRVQSQNKNSSLGFYTNGLNYTLTYRF